MAAIITRRQWTRQPLGDAKIDWSNPLTYGLVWCSLPLDPFVGTHDNAGGVITSLRNVVDPSQVGVADAIDYAYYSSTTPDGDLGTANHSSLTTAFALAPFTGLSGLTELSLASWFYKNTTDGTAQWMNFRTDYQHTLDVYSSNSSSVTWGADWVGAWDGASQQVLSVTNGPVIIGAAIRQSGARFFAQGGLSGTKSGGAAFTTASSSVYILKFATSPVKGNAAWNRALSDSEFIEFQNNPWQLFAPRTRRLYFGAAAGGNTYNVSLAEVMSILDAPSAAAIFAPSIAESLALTDAPSAVMTTNATLAESLTLTDSATAAMIAVASVAESLALADAASAAATFAGTVNESMTVTDAPSASAVFAASVAETLGIADAPSATAVMNVSVVEVMALSDASNTGGQASAVSVGESLAFTDTYSATVIFAGTIAESLALTDAPSATAIWNAVIAEVAALSDLPSATAVMGVTITEVMGFTDAPSAAGVSVLTTDPWYVARAAGRTFIVSAAGRTFVVRSGGR